MENQHHQHSEGLAAKPILNGLLSNEAAYVTRPLLVSSSLKERWMKVEERSSQLLALIQPNNLSEEYRNSVADFVISLITNKFPSSKVVITGSAGMKTYLPEGELDLTVIGTDGILKDSWADEFHHILEDEQKSDSAKFHVEKVEYMPSEEVKILKCIVGTIGVNISFELFSGMQFYYLVEQFDRFTIKQNHLFKRSTILIKAWCNYESRLLGAHHGLISTYALQTMVLYIFQVFDYNSFAGPLEVLYRFLEIYSNFDWDNFCVSLGGPVPIAALPDTTAKPPRNDNKNLLLPNFMTDFMGSTYQRNPCDIKGWYGTFICNHFNVVDPLCDVNNLGRFVSTVNLYKVRSAFAYGAKMLVRLLHCEEDELIPEFDRFFTTTWERYGSGSRPDVLNHEPCPSSGGDPLDGYQYLVNNQLADDSYSRFYYN